MTPGTSRLVSPDSAVRGNDPGTCLASNVPHVCRSNETWSIWNMCTTFLRVKWILFCLFYSNLEHVSPKLQFGTCVFTTPIWNMCLHNFNLEHVSSQLQFGTCVFTTPIWNMCLHNSNLEHVSSQLQIGTCVFTTALCNMSLPNTNLEHVSSQLHFGTCVFTTPIGQGL